MMTRKRLIQSTTAIAAAAAGGGLIGRGVKIAFADDKGEMHKKLTPVELEILRYAALAPSGHNAQPWQLKVKKAESWELGLSPERILPAVDPQNREAKLSLGAFLMNLKIAAPVYGYNVEINFSSSRADSAHAKIILKPTPLSANRDVLSLIENRYTHREKLRQLDLSSAVLKNLAGNKKSVHYISGTSAEGRILSEGTIEANRAQAIRKDAMEELSRWIRWSDHDKAKFMNGITPESMGISGFPLWFVKNFYGPEDVIKPGFIEKSVESAAAAVKNCGGWFVITSAAEDDNQALCETGMIFEDIFLKSRLQGIGIHPMTQMLEEKGFRESINFQLGIKEKIQFIIRTGYANKFPSYIKLRMAPQKFVI